MELCKLKFRTVLFYNFKYTTWVFKHVRSHCFLHCIFFKGLLNMPYKLYLLKDNIIISWDPVRERFDSIYYIYYNIVV